MAQHTLLLAVLCFLYTQAAFAQTPDFGARIVGGRPASINEFPHQIALLDKGRFFCGGSILNPSTILTAAHCVDEHSGKGLSIRAGSTNSGNGGQVKPVKKVIVHPKYNTFTTDYDAAILKLESSLKFGKSVAKISLATTSQKTGAKCTVSGWGLLKEGGKQSTTLQAVDVNIVSQSNCNKAYADQTITSRMICAAAKGKDACQGDSGGPFICSGKLSGIVSWGIGCARPEHPGVYTNIVNKEITDFIAKHS